jgi:ABC-type transport system involved in multi-copper enzyme maturation permease subunit
MKSIYRKSFRTKKTTDAKYIVYSILIVLVFFTLLFAKGLPTHEQMECEQWDAAQYPYYTSWQYDQCRHYNIDLK